MRAKLCPYLFLLALTIIALSGCSTWRLRPDTGPGAVRSGYPSGEVEACGQTWNGLAVCSLDEGEPYDKIKVSIQGFYRGMMRVYSKNCEIDDPVSFDNSSKINVFLPGNAKKDCLITITIAPEYPRREQENLAVYPFRVHIAIKVKKGEAWSGYTMKETGSWNRTLKLPVGGEEEVRVLAEGCGTSFDKKLKVKGGTLEFPLHEAVSRAGVETCILDGVVRSAQYQDYLFSIIMSKYDPEFVPLSPPILMYSDGQIHAIGDNTVSVLALDGQYKIDQTASWKWDAKKSHVMRALTVKGRLALGIWNPAVGAWQWMP